MTSDLRQRARPVFLEVADLVAGDAALRAEVASLLRASDDAGGFMSSPDTAPGARIAQPDHAALGEREGELVGRYKLLQPIGSGGFGTVWMAEQREPVKRRVALKIIKLGMDTRQVIARFEAERQALALMDHPNIARVLDAGSTESGRPYFVMEYIKGVPLMEHCAVQRLDVPARLALFTLVCNAIHHAHQKGVIHRDIKPGNVLVTMHDGVPVPKVIDFGIAKATGAELTGRTLFTEHRQMIGTPAYMSPEQAEMSGLDVDTRSDIYALGVLLYELLTGTTPFDSRELVRNGLAEMARVLREVEPVRPSTRLSTLAAERHPHAPGPARVRSVRPLHGDLDWIVMKCLEKDRNRRYDSASALAADVQRHLADEPVLAGPPGAAYRLQKFVRRHRARVIAASLVGAALVLGTAGTSVGLVYAVRAAGAERAARLDAQRRRVESETNLAYAKRGNEILGSVFASLDPGAEYATAAELRAALSANLGRAVSELDAGSIGDPLEVASMQHTLGESLLRLGEPARAVSVLERAAAARETALGPAAPETLRTKAALGLALGNAGFSDRALALEQEIQPLRAATFGPDHPETITGMFRGALLLAFNRQPDRAVHLAEEAARLAESSPRPDKLDPLKRAQSLAVVYTMCDRDDKALPLYELAAQIATDRHGRSHRITQMEIASLAGARSRAGDTATAIALYEESLALQRERLGRDHPSTLLIMGNLATTYQRAGRYDRAAALFEESLDLRRAKLGPTHPQTIGALCHVAEATWQAGRTADAVAMFEEIVRLNQEKFGATHPDTVNGLARLAEARLNSNDPAGAAADLARAIDARTRALGPEHPETLSIIARRGVALFRLHQHADAERALLAAYTGLAARHADLTPAQRDHLALAARTLADLYAATDRPADADLWKSRIPR